MPITYWNPLQLQQAMQDNSALLLVDVREDNEYAYASIAGSIHIPLRQLPQHLDRFNTDQALVLICHHGIRSLQACQYLQHYGFTDLYNLVGGIDAWSVACDSTVPRY
ncbi:MAG: rhodanese-like domain-containing protein [Methylomonas sp.]